MRWLKRLGDISAKARINLRIRRISLTGNVGDSKLVGEGVCGPRVDCGPGYRVYFGRRGDETSLCSLAATSPPSGAT